MASVSAPAWARPPPARSRSWSPSTRTRLRESRPDCRWPRPPPADGHPHRVAGAGRKAGVRPGDRVLIHAGSGGVGSIAIQLAKHLGAHVATTTSTGNLDWVRALGADDVIDYRTQDFATVLHDYDLVLDSLGGETLEKSLRVVRPGGLVIGIGGPPGPAFAGQLGQPQLPPVMVLVSNKSRRLARRHRATFPFLFLRADGSQLREIATLVEAGALRPVVDRVFDFADTVAALQYVDTGRAKGKVVTSNADAEKF